MLSPAVQQKPFCGSLLCGIKTQDRRLSAAVLFSPPGAFPRTAADGLQVVHVLGATGSPADVKEAARSREGCRGGIRRSQGTVGFPPPLLGVDLLTFWKLSAGEVVGQIGKVLAQCSCHPNDTAVYWCVPPPPDPPDPLRMGRRAALYQVTNPVLQAAYE